MAWVKEIIRKEAHHRSLHEKDMCRCNEVHTEKERRKAREGAAERRKAKRGGNRTAPGHSDRLTTGMAPQQGADGAWSENPYEFTPQQSATGWWNGKFYGTVPQQQRWENGTDGYYPQADRQWENATAEYYQQPDGELASGKQQESTYLDQGTETLKSEEFVPSIDHDLTMPLSNTQNLAMNMISDQCLIVDDQGNNSDSDQSKVVGDQTEIRDSKQSAFVDGLRESGDSDQTTAVGNQVNIRLENTRDLSPSPPVAVGSVTASRQLSYSHPDVWEMVISEDVQPALLKLSVSEAQDNAKGSS